MSVLLEYPPFEARREAEFLKEMNALTAMHMEFCQPYATIWPDWKEAQSIHDLPFLHVGLFKHLTLKTDRPNVRYERVLQSSSTSGNNPSQIFLDRESSALQSQSSLQILQAMVGTEKRPLLILDNVRSLRQRGAVSARVAAAMSLRPLASSLHFMLKEPQKPESMDWDTLRGLLEQHDSFLVYGFTWILWFAWGQADIPQDVREALVGKQFHFVHSGGWKKLEAHKISRELFDSSLLDTLEPSSSVLDYYGLVEQIGVIYPLCSEGSRHVPMWADVIVRDPFSLEPLAEEVGALQLLNTLAHGAPYHNVLTEDMGRLLPGECPCGRKGRRFELIGRIPKAEVRGCANV